MKMPQRALIKRILLAAAGSIILVVFHQFQGVIIEGVRGPLPRVILDPGCLPPPRRGDDKIALVASYFVPPATPSPDWTEIAGITLENHRLAASKSLPIPLLRNLDFGRQSQENGQFWPPPDDA